MTTFNSISWPKQTHSAKNNSILRQTISGLRYLHVNGVIHRDVKAANILVDQTGVVKLADFGASIIIHDDDPQQQQQKRNSQFLTVPQSTSCPCRSFVGTPCWMAPEMIQHLEYTEKVDMWALGITAIELACGSPPFCDGTPATVTTLLSYFFPSMSFSHDNMMF